MRITRPVRSIACLAVAAMLASTALMGDLSVAAHSRATAGSGRTVVRPDQSGPLSVTPALDTARAVSATMAEDGGTLSVTAANGTTFTLTIPANALVSEEEITMTPVAAIPDLPFGQGLSGGGAVELAPEGLLLVQPATLVIHTPSPIAIDQQSPFAWYKAGEDFQLFPLTLDLNSVTMAVDHFNGYGIAAGASTDRAAVASHSPGRSEAQFTQQLEQQTEALRQKLSQSLTKKQAKKAMKNYNSQVLASFVAVFTDLDNQLVNDLGSAGGVVPQARPQAVAPSPAALRCDLLKILVTLINLRNQGKTVADLGSVGNPGLAAHITAALNALEIDSLARCQQGNAGEIGTLLGLARLALIFAALDPSLAGLSTVAKNIGNEAINCVHLKLTFDSTITQVAVLGLAVRVQIELEATVPLVPHISRLISPLPFYSGSAPLVHHIDQITNGTANPCSISDHSTDSTLEIRSMSFDIHLRLVECPGEDAAPATDLDMVIDTGQPLENFTMTCPPPAPGFSTPGNTDIWRAQFYCGHNLGTGLHSATQFFFKNFDMGKEVPGNLATKLFQHLVPPVCPAYEEFTVIKVNLAE